MMVMGVELSSVEGARERAPAVPTLEIIYVPLTDQSWSAKGISVSKPRHLADHILTLLPDPHEAQVSMTLGLGPSLRPTLTVRGPQSSGFHFLLDQPHGPNVEALDLLAFLVLVVEELMRRTRVRERAPGPGGSDVQP